MTRKTKVLIAVICIVAALAVSAAVSYLYWLHHYPVMTVSRVGGNRFDGEGHDERLMLIVSDNPNIPIADSVRERLAEYHDWNDNVITELRNYTVPYDIRVSGEVENGRTTLRYEGYVTTQYGETMDYKNEMTFDIAFDLDF